MSEFSPLRDPVFVLVWQVHLLVVALFALLGIWAGMTRRPWYIAPMLFLALLWLFVPLEAPEPAVVLLLSAPILAIACRFARRWLEKPDDESRTSSPARWRFSLADLLWLTLIVGMLTGLSVQLWRLPWERYFDWSADKQKFITSWPEAALSATCLGVLGLAVLVASRQRTRLKQFVGLAVVCLLAFAAAGIHSAFISESWLLIVNWKHYVWAADPDGGTPGDPTYGDLFIIYLWAFLEFAVVLWLGLRALTPLAWSPVSRVERATRMAAGACLLSLIVGLAIMFVAMQIPPAWPKEISARNDREALWGLLVRHDLSPHEDPFRDLDTVENAPAPVLKLFGELHDLLERDSITWVDGQNDDLRSIDRSLTEKGNSVRDLAISIGAQAKADWLEERRAEALKHDLLCMRLGEAMQKRGTLLYCLMGKAFEGIALEHFARIRRELDSSEIYTLVPHLEQLAAGRESSELILARDAAYNERTIGWRRRIWLVSHRLLKIELEHEQAALLTFNERDARLALLRTDLALRSYQQTHGRWPESLAFLVPHQLPAVPLDPFSGQPLVYRVGADGFVLYSVGRDGVDNGGKVGNITRVLFESGYDLDLDAWYRDY